MATPARDEAMRKKGYVPPMIASALAKTPPATIYGWVRDGVVKSVRVGAGRGRVYISLTSLKRVAGILMEA